MSSKFVKFLQRIRVFSGFVIAIVFLVFSRPTPVTLAVGLSVALIGVLLRAWACGHLRKSSELDVSGPYAHTRNPLYLGTFIIALGFGVALHVLGKLPQAQLADIHAEHASPSVDVAPIKLSARQPYAAALFASPESASSSPP